MDTSGKGGIMRHVVGQMDPQGVRHTAFKAPTAEERSHDFLWRIRRALPGAGEVGVFDRSHYEDVLIVRVHDLVPRATWERRYAAINRFEASLVDRGHDDRQGDAPPVAAGAGKAPVGAAGPAGQALEVQPATTSTSAPSGTTTRRRTRSR